MIALLRVLRDNPLDVSFGGGGHTLISRKQQPTASGRHRERRSPQSKQVPSFANHRDRLLTTLECASQVTRRRRLTRRRRGVGRVLNSYKREMDGLPPEPLPIVSHLSVGFRPSGRARRETSRVLVGSCSAAGRDTVIDAPSRVRPSLQRAVPAYEFVVQDELQGPTPAAQRRPPKSRA